MADDVENRNTVRHCV